MGIDKQNIGGKDIKGMEKRGYYLYVNKKETSAYGCVKTAEG